MLDDRICVLMLEWLRGLRMVTTIKVDGIVVCWIHKRNRYGMALTIYEVSFPQEETLKSLYFGDISEVHKWLDRDYEGWVVV